MFDWHQYQYRTFNLPSVYHTFAQAVCNASLTMDGNKTDFGQRTIIKITVMSRETIH